MQPHDRWLNAASALVIVALTVLAAREAHAGWTAIGPEGGDVSALAINPAAPSTLYAGTQGGGVFESTNAGANWTAVSTGLTNTKVSALAIDPTTPSTLYAGTDGGGVFQSTNGGTSWTAINTGLTNLSVHTFAINPVTPSTVYAGTNGDSVFVLPAVCGDVNGDGVVNIGDALIVAQYDVGLRTCGQAPFSQPKACDVNGDGACNVGDALRMAQCDVGLISCAFTCGPFACSSTTTTTTTSGTTSSISTVPTTTVPSTTSTTFPTCSELLGHCGASSCSGVCVAHQPDNALECVANFTCQFPIPCSSDADCAGGGACFSDGSGHTACCTSGCACTPASCLGATTTTTLPSPCGGECANCGTCGAGVCVVAGGTTCGHVGSGDVCVDGHSCTASSCTADADCGAGTVCVVEGHGAHLCCSTCS
ncbi:MAG: hypothetical protein E6J60_09060 [Deltaproteobacteria bacterium]|nr:MAG: hypothetical protein E6J60_09060 [Deltaproteobacteria bacterium]